MCRLKKIVRTVFSRENFLKLKFAYENYTCIDFPTMMINAFENTSKKDVNMALTENP